VEEEEGRSQVELRQEQIEQQARFEEEKGKRDGKRRAGGYIKKQ
jgi:hypothetical protein